MKPDETITSVPHMRGRRLDHEAVRTNEDRSDTNEREQIADVVQRSRDTSEEVKTETLKLLSGLTSHYVVEKLKPVYTPLEAPVEHNPKSRRVSTYAAADIICREDPW